MLYKRFVTGFTRKWGHKIYPLAKGNPMKRIITLAKKLIPAYIEVRSLYWVEYGKAMDEALHKIFRAIDDDLYDEAQELINEFETRFNQSEGPFWIGLKYSEIYRASSMLVCLRTPLDDTDYVG
jgi:hypothetical protein